MHELKPFALGMWGAKIFQRRLPIKDAAMQLFDTIEHKLEYGFDQILLKQFMWPLTIDDLVRLWLNMLINV